MLQKSELQDRGIYALKSRNLRVGVWNGSDGFIGIRTKFGDRFLSTEFIARECGGTASGFDTAHPLEQVGTLAEDIPLVERKNPALFAALDEYVPPEDEPRVSGAR